MTIKSDAQESIDSSVEALKAVGAISDKMLTPDEIKDSTKLQLYSLVSYLEALGYHFMINATGNSWFASGEYVNKARSIISFSTAVDIYNRRYKRHNKLEMDYPFDFSTYALTKAEATRIVNFCNLQMNKKTGYIKATSNLVSFTKYEYYEAFIKSKYFPF